MNSFEATSANLRVENLRRWLSATLDEQEVDRAIQLPEEVLRNLYGNIFNLGPAGEEIAEVLEAIDDIMQRGAPTLSSKLDSLRRISSSPFLGPILVEGFNLSSWLRRNGYTSLVQKLIEPSEIPFVHADYQRGIYALLWMLNGQYVFPHEAIDHSSPFIEEANSILRLLELPQLSGSFAGDAEKS